MDPTLSSVTKFELSNLPNSKNLELCLRLFPKLDTFKFYGENYFNESDEESDEESGEESDTENIPLELLENLSRTIPYIQFEDGTVHTA